MSDVVTPDELLLDHDAPELADMVVALRAEVAHLKGLVEQAAKLKTVGGVRPGYQERGQWQRGTMPPPPSALDGPATVPNLPAP